MLGARLGSHTLPDTATQMWLFVNELTFFLSRCKTYLPNLVLRVCFGFVPFCPYLVAPVCIN